MAKLISKVKTLTGTVISLWQGDITEQEADAIVNAANEHLRHGGGVAGAIVRKGGHVIQEESDRKGHVPTGQVVATGAGKLHAQYVFHAVGPVYRSPDPKLDDLLESAVWNSLLLGHEKGLKSIAFPAISSGIFGFPKDRCAQILIGAALKFAQSYPDSALQDIRFVIIDEITVNAFAAEFKNRFGPELENG